MANVIAPATIELRLGAISQLFRTEDPFPFRDSDLAREAEDYLVARAKEAGPRQPLRILVHLTPAADGRVVDATAAAHRIATGFQDLAAAEATAIRELFRNGRRALAIGLAVLAICLFIAWRTKAGLGDGALTTLVHESSVIFGWVAIWRPAEIFLYEWLPKARRLMLLRRLSAAEIILRPDAASQTA